MAHRGDKYPVLECDVFQRKCLEEGWGVLVLQIGSETSRYLSIGTNPRVDQAPDGRIVECIVLVGIRRRCIDACHMRGGKRRNGAAEFELS